MDWIVSTKFSSALATLVLSTGLLLTGCSSAGKRDKEISLEGRRGTPHPGGYSVAQLMEIFVMSHSPSLADLETCDQLGFDFTKKNLIGTVTKGFEARELVRTSPNRAHWCFYAKLVDLMNPLGEPIEQPVEQRKLLSTYLFLTPIARAFIEEHSDPHYLSFASHYYRILSRRILGQPVEFTAELTRELVTAWRRSRTKKTKIKRR